MVADCQYTNALVNDTIEKMKRKSIKIHTSDITLANRVSFWGTPLLFGKMISTRIELISELLSSRVHVVVHDLGDVGSNLTMKFQFHQRRRLWIWESNSAREIA